MAKAKQKYMPITDEGNRTTVNYGAIQIAFLYRLMQTVNT